MAHLEPMGKDGLDRLYETLIKLTTDVEGIAKLCVDEASPIGEKAYKGALQGVRVPDELPASVNTTKSKKNFLGVFSVSRPLGKNRKGVRYAAIAAIVNYGWDHRLKKKYPDGKGHYGLEPHPWFERAVKAAEEPVAKKVQETFDREVKRLIE